MAFGGNSVKGVVKENKDLKVNFGIADRGRDVADTGWAIDATARQKRKRQAAEKRARIAILGGRMIDCSVAQSIGRLYDIPQIKKGARSAS